MEITISIILNAFFGAIFAFSLSEFLLEILKQEVTIPIILGLGYLSYNLRSAAARTNFKKVVKDNIKFSWTKQSGFKEILIFVSFLVFYKISRFVAIGDESTAFANAYRVIEWEKQLGIFNEISVQRFFDDKESLIKFLNQIYLRVHVPSTVIFFVWLYHWHKNYYFYVRNAFMLANVITIFFFIGFPCAPPRMLNEVGFVDTLRDISNINIYKGKLSYLFNQFAAMPSMHFGTSLLLAMVIWYLSKNFIMRWGIWIYPPFVLLVIVATANHFYLDAVLGGLIVIFPFIIMPIIWKKYRAKNLRTEAEQLKKS